MKYLLDTDVLSNLLRSPPATLLLAKLSLVPLQDQATSSITLGELTYGAHRLSERSGPLLRRLDSVLPPERHILPFDETAAHHYGELRAELERRGTPIGDADVRIAAIALARGLTVVTGNVRHFARVPGLVVENWLA